MTDEARGLLIVAALLLGGGFVGGRVTAPAPPAEVRFVHVPVPAVPIAPPVAAPIEPAEAPPAAAPNEPAPPAAAPPPVEVSPLPLPTPRPKVEAKPQPKPEKAAAKRPRATVPATRALPSCAAIKREYESMTWAQQMAAYHRATAQEVAHGKRCLGF